VLYERSARQTWMVTVSLDTGTVVSDAPMPGVQPPLMMEKWAASADQIKADPRFRAAMARRGITDMAKVQIDPWPTSNFGLHVNAPRRRLARGWPTSWTGPAATRTPSRWRTSWPSWTATPARCSRSRTARWCRSRRGHQTVALARSETAADAVIALGARPVTGDLNITRSLVMAFTADECDVLVNLASLGFGPAFSGSIASEA
jgi:hypothetical protein